VDTRGVAFLTALAQPTTSVVTNFERQYDFYKSIFDEDEGNVGKKFPVRTITIFNRLALVLDDGNGRRMFENSSIDSINAFRGYQSGGLMNQVRPPIIMHYRSLAETMSNTPVPQMLRGEDWEAGKGVDIHLSLAASLNFHEKLGYWPRLHNHEDADQLVKIAEEISNERKSVEGSCWSQKIQYGFPTGEPRELDKKTIARYSRLFPTELTGFCAFLGGAIAQEVIKASGKFTPIDQWVHHDEGALVVDECISNVSPLFGSRYDYQMAIMGKDFQERIANQRIFLVGCGALGCEYLKGLALMGAGTGKDGKIWVSFSSILVQCGIGHVY
jgi:ubiquitin-activating enzyme E1